MEKSSPDMGNLSLSDIREPEPLSKHSIFSMLVIS